MSNENGNGKRILSLDAARETKVRKGNDFITVQQCYDLVIQECAKVHEYYLTQIPGYVANMIADALVDRGLIPEFRTGPEATAEAPVVSENAGGDTVPADSTAPAERPSSLIVDVTGTAIGEQIPDGGRESIAYTAKECAPVFQDDSTQGTPPWTDPAA